jgi:hypothetical protein
LREHQAALDLQMLLQTVCFLVHVWNAASPLKISAKVFQVILNFHAPFNGAKLDARK